MAFNYPLSSSREQDFARLFFNTALIEDSNLYYYPKPNHYTEIDDFAFFALRRNLTPENLRVESLYRHKHIDRAFRGQLHNMFRREKSLDTKHLNKRFFPESRMLFNLSYEWKAFDAPKENVRHDLLDKVDVFYPYPTMANIATLNICNLTCVMCPMFSKEHRKTIQNDFFAKKQLLDAKAVYKILDFLSLGKQNSVSFIALGEPLLDERLSDFIAYAKSKKIAQIGLTTNGLLLHKKGESILNAGLNRMTISIDGATKETYYKIRGADLDRVESNVKQCVEYARKRNLQGADIEFELNCVLAIDELESEKDLYLSKWQDYRDIIRKIHFTRMVVYDSNGMDKNKRALPLEQLQATVCPSPWNSYQVDCYGNVSVCCIMQNSAYYNNPVSIGNVLTEEPCAIWHGDRARNLRAENLSMNFSKQWAICKDCTERFKSCLDETHDGFVSITGEMH